MIDPAALDRIHKHFDAVVVPALNDAYLVRDPSVQAGHRLKLDELREEVRNAKIEAINAEAERPANFLLGLQAMIDALIAELEMVRLLKDGKPHDAWISLITAQENVRLARRTPAAGRHLEDYQWRLHCHETALFPRLVFISSGLIHDVGVCTICGASFGDCAHLEGLIYCGRVCAEVDFKNVRLEHAAIVENPRDRRCYMRTIRHDGGPRIDVMTGLAVDGTFSDGPGDESGDGGLTSEVVLFVNKVPPGVVP